MQQQSSRAADQNKSARIVQESCKSEGVTDTES